VTLAVLDLVAARLAAAQELVEQHSSQPVERRIAAMLLKLGDKLGEQRESDLLIQMPLSRQDLADMAGTTIETASRVMSQLRRAGLIRSGRRWVALVDRDRLAHVANPTS
jgi:CRP-like cAMP-binding protein